MNAQNIPNIEQTPIAPFDINRTYDQIVVYCGGAFGTPKPYKMSFEALEAVLSGLQPLSAELSAIADLGTTGIVERTAKGSYSTTAIGQFARQFLTINNQIDAKTALGLMPGLQIQAYSVSLTNLDSVGTDGALEKVGDRWSTYTVSPFGKELIGDNSQIEAQNTLGLVPGVDVQKHSDRLDAFSLMEGNGILRKSGNKYETVDLSEYGEQLLALAGQPEAQAVLGCKPGVQVQAYSEALEDLADACDRESDGFLRKIGGKLHFVPVDAGIVDTVSFTADRCFEVDQSNGENVAINLSFRSQPANYFLASPNGGEGALEPRPLAVADLPDLSGTYQRVTANLSAIANLQTSGLLKHDNGDVSTVQVSNVAESLLTAQSVDDMKKLLGIEHLEDAINGLRSLMVLLQQSMIEKK